MIHYEAIDDVVAILSNLNSTFPASGFWQSSCLACRGICMQATESLPPPGLVRGIEVHLYLSEVQVSQELGR
jgi:hypothetical protein